MISPVDTSRKYGEIVTPSVYSSVIYNNRKRLEIPEKAESEERVTPIEDIPEDLDPMYSSGDFLYISI